MSLGKERKSWKGREAHEGLDLSGEKREERGEFVSSECSREVGVTTERNQEACRCSEEAIFSFTMVNVN